MATGCSSVASHGRREGCTGLLMLVGNSMGGNSAVGGWNSGWGVISWGGGAWSPTSKNRSVARGGGGGVHRDADGGGNSRVGATARWGWAGGNSGGGGSAVGEGGSSTSRNALHTICMSPKRFGLKQS